MDHNAVVPQSTDLPVLRGHGAQGTKAPDRSFDNKFAFQALSGTGQITG